MDGKFDSRHALVGLVDEVSRLNGRLKSLFASSRRTVGLGQSDSMVLNAVVESDRPPTVPQIGRSLGFPRQLVQRAANALVAQGLIETLPNPDHKRAPLLAATTAGVALKRRADAEADGIAAAMFGDVDEAALRAAVSTLRGVRKQIEARLRSTESASGQVPTGQVPTGQVPTGQVPTGERSR